ncbi:DUF2922 domain-containing protein [Enterococcus sp. DIV0756]|uniref:DUF2922 domain-containing protein n=1 Tax=Enterococcus sp. DIV0756 TaxID=2774636 RepID=UPI003F26E895
MKKIEAVFTTSSGRSQTWSYPNPGEGKANQEIQDILEEITVLNLFKKDDEKLFNEVIRAKYVETIETVIF